MIKKYIDGLDHVMQNEYEAVSGMGEPVPEILKAALDTIRTKMSDKEYLKIESDIYTSYINAEKFGFEQGFMRGIVVVKGGAA